MKKDDDKKTDFNYEIDEEEAAILHAMDEGQFEAEPDQEERKKEAQQQAIAFSQLQRKSINIRIPEYNLTRIRQQADKKGLPYQTLINSIIQQYLEQLEASEKTNNHSVSP